MRARRGSRARSRLKTGDLDMDLCNFLVCGVYVYIYIYTYNAHGGLLLGMLHG